MRNSRDRWSFIEHPSKPPLTTAEVLYWRNVKNIMKVGMEFEFNLPDQTGTCKGDSKTCPCIHMADNECWKDCQNLQICKETPVLNKCSNKTNECKPEDCTRCGNYTPICHGVFCPDFVSQCFSCEKFETDCDNCGDRYDPNKNPSEIRKMVTSELTPSNCYGLVSGVGVHSIIRDGSLLGDHGMEVVTVGRRVDYWEFYKMAKKILDAAVSRGAYVNERCSTHMHLLASYYGKLGSDSKAIDHTRKIPGIPTNINELERSMPEIILANFHQLCRRYQNTITWMTMTLDDPKRMTRWEKFRASILHISGILNSMSEVKMAVYKGAGNTKYGWVNYNNCRFSGDGNITRFHVEMRAADGILCPSPVAALGCMYYALFVKAVEISKYGVLEMEDSEWMAQASTIKEAMLNNMKDYGAGDRFGDTSNLMQYADTLRTEGYDLIRQLKHILIKFGPSYHILEKLVERPIALRRCGGETWEEIEKDLEAPISDEGQFEVRMGEFIDLRLIDECRDPEEWIKSVGLALREDPEFPASDGGIEEKVAAYVGRKRNDGELIWSDTLGSIVTI